MNAKVSHLNVRDSNKLCNLQIMSLMSQAECLENEELNGLHIKNQLKQLASTLSGEAQELA